MKKIALITALVIGTGSVALATEFDPNLANRYPTYAAPKAQSMITKDVEPWRRPVAVADGRPREQPERGRRLSPNEVPRTGSPRAGSHPEQPARPPSRRLFFFCARDRTRETSRSIPTKIYVTPPRAWARRTTRAAQTHFLSAQRPFLKETSSIQAQCDSVVTGTPCPSLFIHGRAPFP